MKEKTETEPNQQTNRTCRQEPISSRSEPNKDRAVLRDAVPCQDLSPRCSVLPSACSRPAVHPDVSGTWTCICPGPGPICSGTGTYTHPAECRAASWLEHISCKNHAPLMLWLRPPAAPVPAVFVLYKRSNQITCVTKQRHIKGHREAGRLTWSQILTEWTKKVPTSCRRTRRWIQVSFKEPKQLTTTATSRSS